MINAKRLGWVLTLAEIGLDSSSTPADFSKLASSGLGVIVRINHGYGSTGTLPLPDKYPDFAKACAAYVARSNGCHIWIIGNEPNHNDERPQGRPILPGDYAGAYRLCRNAIHGVPGHEGDQVLVAGSAPWNATTAYAGNEKGDWVRYFSDVLVQLDDDGCDGFALHTYTHYLDPKQITGDYFQRASGYQYLRNEFRTYLDYMNAIPDRFRHLSVFITETDPTTPDIGWNPGANIGWVRTAYNEIAEWNSDPNHQPILALILYRWPLVPDQPEWAISTRGGIIEDFKAALTAAPASNYLIRMPHTVEPPVVLAPGNVLDSEDQWQGMVLSPLGLNQRTGPSMDHAIIQFLPNETQLTVLADLDDWLYVSALDRVGYVSSAFVVHGHIGGFMPYVTSPGTATGDFLRTRPDLLNGALEPNATEQLTIDPEKATLIEQAVANAWNKFGALVTKVAKLLEIDPAVALAVLAIESGGSAFGNDGRMLIRFENHIFYDQWGKQHPDLFNQHFRFDPNQVWQGHQWRPSADQPWRDFHGNPQAEWEVFNFARNLAGPEAAMSAISMGAPQIMGFNHDAIGFATAQAMFDAFSSSPQAQIVSFFDFIKSDQTRLNALRTGDYTAFAGSYNGPGQAPLYASLIQAGIDTFNSLRSQQSNQSDAASSADNGSALGVESIKEPNEGNTNSSTENNPDAGSATGAVDGKTDGSTEGNTDTTSRLPVPPHNGNLAEVDPELYAAWRNHVLTGFTNNQKMFEQLVNAFMGPYYTTVQLYRVTFAVGILALIAAAILSYYTGRIMFGLLFGGISMAAFISYFVTRPLRALEENLNFITWLGVIYNSYWTRLVYAMNLETVQTDIAAITNDFTKQMQELIDKSAAIHKDRSGID